MQWILYSFRKKLKNFEKNILERYLFSLTF